MARSTIPALHYSRNIGNICEMRELKTPLRLITNNKARDRCQFTQRIMIPIPLVILGVIYISVFALSVDIPGWNIRLQMALGAGLWFPGNLDNTHDVSDRKLAFERALEAGKFPSKKAPKPDRIKKLG